MLDLYFTELSVFLRNKTSVRESSMTSFYRFLTEFNSYQISKILVQRLQNYKYRTFDLNSEKHKSVCFVLSDKFTEPFNLSQTLITILESDRTIITDNYLSVHHRAVLSYTYSFDDPVFGIRKDNKPQKDYDTVILSVTDDPFREIISLKFGPWIIQIDPDENFAIDQPLIQSAEKYFFKDDGFEQDE